MSLILLQWDTSRGRADRFLSQRSSKQVHLNVVVDMIRHVVVGITGFGESGSPVESAVFGIRLVWHVEIKVGGVAEDSLDRKHESMQNLLILFMRQASANRTSLVFTCLF